MWRCLLVMWLGKRYIPFVPNIIWCGVSRLGLVNIIWWVQTIVFATRVTNLEMYWFRAGVVYNIPVNTSCKVICREYISTHTSGVMLNITSYYYY